MLFQIKKKSNYGVLRNLLSFIIHDNENMREGRKEEDFNSVDLI